MIRGIKRDADEQHHNRQEDDAGKKVHDLEFTHLIYATLDLAMNKIDADTEQDGAECRDKGLDFRSSALNKRAAP